MAQAPFLSYPPHTVVAMQPQAPHTLLTRAAQWEDLSRWERAELGRALRRLGWSYGEVMQVIPVPKGTLAGWCREIRLSDEQAAAIRRRTGSVRGVPRDTQWRRREEIEEIRAAAKEEVPSLIDEPLWLAGTVMYWAEGSKTDRSLSLANSDPRAGSMFIRWTRRYLMPDAVVVLKLNLHAGNDEEAAQAFWISELDVDPSTRFYKTFLKPEGTGHRKNTLPYGVAQIRVRRSSDAFHRVMAWIDGVGNLLLQSRS